MEMDDKLNSKDHKELEVGRRPSTAVGSPEEDEKDVKMSWRKRSVYTLRRKGVKCRGYVGEL